MAVLRQGHAGLGSQPQSQDPIQLPNASGGRSMKSIAAAWTFVPVSALACIVGTLASQHGNALEPLPRPADGAVIDGAYTNRYFDLVYPLPPGWTEGLAGPPASHTGYYVLSTLIRAGEF